MQTAANANSFVKSFLLLAELSAVAVEFNCVRVSLSDFNSIFHFSAKVSFRRQTERARTVFADAKTSFLAILKSARSVRQLSKALDERCARQIERCAHRNERRNERRVERADEQHERCDCCWRRATAKTPRKKSAHSFNIASVRQASAFFVCAANSKLVCGYRSEKVGRARRLGTKLAPPADATLQHKATRASLIIGREKELTRLTKTKLFFFALARTRTHKSRQPLNAKDLSPATRVVARRKCASSFAARQTLVVAVDANSTTATTATTPASRPTSVWLAADYANCAPADSRNSDHKQLLVEQRALALLVEQLERIEPFAIDAGADSDAAREWRRCIALVAGQLRAADVGRSPATSAQCPAIFDGWRCWPPTPAGETALRSCPPETGFVVNKLAHKICEPDGQWFRHPQTNKFWSNYTTCIDTADLAFRTKIINLNIIGNLISLLALSVSLLIFVSFKSLKCTRVTIHKNLFLSFVTNNVMWIVWYSYVVSNPEVLQANPAHCQVLHVLVQYTLVSNYFWMFCEGFYLHTVLVLAFVDDDKLLKWFYALGWLAPMPIIVAYAASRLTDARLSTFCCMEETAYNQILTAPSAISLLLNLIFLINIVRVLVTKLRANISPDTHQTRKAARATLILIPLLGLHYILMPFRPEAGSEYEAIYEIVSAVTSSFQGLCVAMLFCFCNGEVMQVIKKWFKLKLSLS